jgi:hypothetical protein
MSVKEGFKMRCWGRWPRGKNERSIFENIFDMTSQKMASKGGSIVWSKRCRIKNDVKVA